MLQSMKAVFQEHSNSEPTVRGERNLARLQRVIDSGSSRCIQVHGRNALLRFLADQRTPVQIWRLELLGPHCCPGEPGVYALSVGHSCPTRTTHKHVCT